MSLFLPSTAPPPRCLDCSGGGGVVLRESRDWREAIPDDKEGAVSCEEGSRLGQGLPGLVDGQQARIKQGTAQICATHETLPVA